MNEESQLIYPTVDLFLYDLREGLRQNSERVELNRQTFWQRIYGKLDKSTLAILAAAESSIDEYVELLGANKVKKFERLEPPYKGFYYPIQLKIDTYALLVECSTGFNVNGQISCIPHPISIFRQIIEHEIKPRIYNQEGGGKLGQTWLIWGQLPAECKEPKKIAKECYSKLAPNGEWDADFQGEGMLSGGTLFELWQAPPKYESISETYHLMIWLFPARDSIDLIEESVEKIYVDFIHLFIFRSKIIWADYQSRQLAEDLKKDFKDVQEVIDTVSQMPSPIKSPQ
jgi:hypothetical protein